MSLQISVFYGDTFNSFPRNILILGIENSGETRKEYMLVGKPEGKKHFRDLEVDGEIILNCF